MVSPKQVRYLVKKNKQILPLKDRIVNILAVGILILLGFIVVGDFTVALEENRPIDDSVIHLLQITITGLIGIIGTYFGMNNNNKKE